MSRDCLDGVHYFREIRDTLSIIKEGLVDAGPAHTVVTFGCAVGETAPDPLFPDCAVRAVRYAVLAIIVQAPSATTGRLRERYGVPVTVRPFTARSLADVKAAVAGKLRNVPSGEFFDQLAAERIMPGSGHICDIYPRHFGWKTWFLNDDGKLTEPAPLRPAQHRRRAFIEAHCSHGFSPPVAACPCGVSYHGTAFFCVWYMEDSTSRAVAAGRPGLDWAATYGYAGGPILEGFGRPNTLAWRARRFTPLRICIPEARGGSRGFLLRRYGMPVETSTSTQTLHRVEREVRAELEGVDPAALFAPRSVVAP